MTITLDYSKLRKLHPNLKHENDSVSRIFLNLSYIKDFTKEDLEIIKYVTELFEHATVTIFGVPESLKDKVNTETLHMARVSVFNTLIDYDKRNEECD